MIEKSHSAYLI